MTIREALAQSIEQRGDHVALRFKRNGGWRTFSYRELLERVRQVAEVVADLGGRPGDRVAICLENTVEWAEIYLGIVGRGVVAVPMDAKLMQQEVTHILRDSGARILITDEKHYVLIKDIEAELPALEHVVLLGGRVIQPAPSQRARYHDYETLLTATSGPASSSLRAYDREKPAESDLASLIYTSGTTGRQKGAMLTHGNFMANVESCRQAIEVVAEDNFLLVLPLHHSFAFTTNLLLPLAVGAEISLVESLKTVGENTREVRPTVLIAVPLLLEKMYARIWGKLQANLLGYTLFRAGIRRPVLRRIAEGLGGRIRLMISGGAPCDPDILRGFMNLGFAILEGYGLTETAPVLTLNPLNAPKPGTVGKPLPDVDIRIVDPDPDGIGEIAARGPNVMQGYYNLPEATAEAFHDGWFLTGDQGFIDDEGYVTISGRKKSLIVNREGKNIYPEEVETAICKSPYIREALALGCRVPGSKVGESVGLIVVPDQDALARLASEKGQILTEAETLNLMRSEVKAMSANMADYKRPRNIQMRMEEFEKTSTGKIKRYLYAMDEQPID